MKKGMSRFVWLHKTLGVMRRAGILRDINETEGSIRFSPLFAAESSPSMGCMVLLFFLFSSSLALLVAGTLAVLSFLLHIHAHSSCFLQLLFLKPIDEEKKVRLGFPGCLSTDVVECLRRKSKKEERGSIHGTKLQADRLVVRRSGKDGRTRYRIHRDAECG